MPCCHAVCAREMHGMFISQWWCFWTPIVIIAVFVVCSESVRWTLLNVSAVNSAIFLIQKWSVRKIDCHWNVPYAKTSSFSLFFDFFSLLILWGSHMGQQVPIQSLMRNFLCCYFDWFLTVAHFVFSALLCSNLSLTSRLILFDYFCCYFLRQIIMFVFLLTLTKSLASYCCDMKTL